ncbi:MAG: thioredoxin [Euryarchaeota archaeon]|nr:thioredoxin [Euryarchaeota archaeon]
MKTARITMAGAVQELTEGNFDSSLEGADKLAIVEFYTNTCVNCMAMRPVYEALAIELEKYALFARINVAESQAIAARYGIMGVPTFKFFCGQRPIGELVGAINATILGNTIKDFVRHKNECISKSTPIIYEMDGYG